MSYVSRYLSWYFNKWTLFICVVCQWLFWQSMISRCFIKLFYAQSTIQCVRCKSLSLKNVQENRNLIYFDNCMIYFTLHNTPNNQILSHYPNRITFSGTRLCTIKKYLCTEFLLFIFLYHKFKVPHIWAKSGLCPKGIALLQRWLKINMYFL